MKNTVLEVKGVRQRRVQLLSTLSFLLSYFSAIAGLTGDRQPNFLCRFSLLEKFLEIDEISPQGRWRKDDRPSWICVLDPEDG